MTGQRMAQRRWGGSSSMACAMAVAGWLAGCSALPGNPATAPPSGATAEAAGVSGTAVPSDASGASQAPGWHQALAAKGCAVPDGVVDRLQHLRNELEPLGLEPRLQGCQDAAPQHAKGQGAGPALLLDAWVTDGQKALAVVRGPMADGEPLDLGLQPAGMLPDDAVSPDVRFNRQWWRQRLSAYGLLALPGQARAFVPSP